jgi:prolyl-tRNA synthetase
MLFSRSFIPTLREVPSEAETVAHQLMLRAGLIRKLAAGIYDWLPTGLRVLKKVEQIVREEMNAIDGQEVWLPQLQPRELWEETGRWPVYGKELMRLKDRKNADFCLAPTAEEVVTDLVRRDVRSYRQLPLMLYQFGVKYRDEIRPRFGVMRAREFYMKDAYSFHVDEKDAERYYQSAFNAYRKVFDRLGLRFRPVEAESGAIGGSYSHEFMVLADTGEEGIVSCACGYAANIERAEINSKETKTIGAEANLEEVATPNATSVEAVGKLLKRPERDFLKLLVVLADEKPVIVLVRGDHELNEAKLSRLLKAERIVKANEATYVQATNSPVGFGGPVGLQGPIYADFAVSEIADGIAGGGKKDVHLVHVVPGRDFKPVYADLRKAVGGDLCPRCGKPLEFSRGIEVGHTFKLGTKYSSSMKATYLDTERKPQPIVMGCYGIGVSRVVAACIEQRHDANGIMWPEAIAPWRIEVVPLNIANPAIKELADRVYTHLRDRGIEVLMDDRDEHAGVKLKDADLLGVPYRLVIGERKLAEGNLEFRRRDVTTSDTWPTSEVLQRLDALLVAKPGF